MSRAAKGGTALTSTLFLVGKGLFCLSAFLVDDFIKNDKVLKESEATSDSIQLTNNSNTLVNPSSISILGLTTCLLFFSSIIFILLQRSWSLLLSLSRKRLIILIANSILIFISVLYALYGIKNAGPLRFIFLQYTETLLIFIPGLLCTFASISGTKRNAAILCFLSILAIIWNKATAGVLPGKAVLETGAVAASVDDPTKASPLLSDIFLGVLSILLSVSASSISKSYERKNSKEFGGRKGLHSISNFMAAILAFVLYTFQSPAVPVATATDGTLVVPPSSPLTFGQISTFGFIIFFFIVLQFYVESIALKPESPKSLYLFSLIVCFVLSTALDSVKGNGGVTFSIILGGIGLTLANHLGGGYDQLAGAAGDKNLLPFTSPAKATSSNQPLGSGGGYGLPGFSYREIRVMIKHFLSDQTSSRIFFFLSINLLFMFVELIYGFYSNSLGLISDAGHMLFDSVALGIGLYASFVSKIKANQVYTYGYGRHEIISGYVNGVFLLFIGYFVFVESVERLFKPPEIEGESLVIVSVLGLCVNLVGLVFFHDFSHGHSHSGDGGHGHSHGSHGGGGCASDDHGHSHGNGAEAAKPAAQQNHNVWAIYLHILADALGSVGVIISSILVKYWNWTSSDAICSMIISVLIIGSVIPLMQNTTAILLQRSPLQKEKQLRDALRQVSSIKGVLSYKDPHFWSFSDAETIGTLSVQISEDVNEQMMLNTILDIFKSNKLIDNMSIQLEKEKFINSLDSDARNKPLLTAGQM